VKWCIACGAALALLVGVAGARDARADPAPFVVQQAAGYRGDPPGSMRPETVPDAIEPGRWPVDVEIRAPLCATDGLYSWSQAGTTVPSVQTGRCRYRLFFSQRGDHLVTLRAEIGGATRSASAHVAARGWLIAVIGDSVASGEGVPDVPGVLHARWQSPRCHRSARAAPSLAALALQRADPGTPVTFVSLACSGASIGKGLLEPYRGLVRRRGSPLDAQVDALRLLAQRRPIDALVISAGANDLHFGDIVKACTPLLHPLRFRACFDRSAPWGGNLTVRVAVADAVAQLPERYAQLAKQLETMRIKHVLLLQYFDPLTGPGGAPCRSIIGITGAMLADARRDVLAPLNQVGKEAAWDHGWGYVDGVEQQFAGHGYCAAPADRWVVTLSETLHDQSGLAGRIAGVLHPNAAGHRAIAALIASKLETALIGRTTKPNEVSDAIAGGLAGAGLLALAGLVGVGVRRSVLGHRARRARTTS